MDTFTKDPDTTLDYKKDWSLWLAASGNDTIVASSWLCSDSAITIDAKPSTFTTEEATVWLSGGTIDGSYVITNRITTDNGRVADSSLRIVVRGK
jgi:hypothetical protein